MKKLILFLVRRRLGIRKYEMFQFSNQKSGAVYYFADDRVMKLWNGYCEPSGVSLNWLLDSECKITTDINIKLG